MALEKVAELAIVILRTEVPDTQIISRKRALSARRLSDETASHLAMSPYETGRSFSRSVLLHAGRFFSTTGITSSSAPSSGSEENERKEGTRAGPGQQNARVSKVSAPEQARAEAAEGANALELTRPLLAKPLATVESILKALGERSWLNNPD